MNFYVNQSICIQSLKVSAVSNSSVLQIGSAGIIKPNSNLFNTGGFTGPAPDEQKKGFSAQFLHLLSHRHNLQPFQHLILSRSPHLFGRTTDMFITSSPYV